MAVFFAANAFWWAYRAGATLARAYLNWEAGRRGTTLEAAFRNAKFRRSRGQLSFGEMALINFVQFNDRWRWTSGLDFTLDSTAVATAGLGLLAKVGLGNRILTVLGVKNAPTAGVVIDGLIDALGAMLTGGGEARVPSAGDITKALAEVLARVEQSDLVKHGTNVVNATVKLGNLIQPFLGLPAEKLILKGITSAPAIIDAAANLFGSILGLWGVVEEHLPRPERRVGMRGAPPLTDPVFRNALARMKPPDVGPARPIPTPVGGVTGPPAQVEDVLFGEGFVEEAEPGPFPPGPFVTEPEVLTGPDEEERARFVRMFSNSLGGLGGSLGALKGRERARTFPFG